MARITRQAHRLFGNDGSSDNFAKFGSLVAGTPVKTKDLATIQALPAWDDGFQEAIFGANKDLLLEDLNAFCFEHSYQLAYVFQDGIPEWQSATTYFLDSVVKGPAGGASAGQWFQSLQDNNTGNPPPAGASNAFWNWVNQPPVVDAGLTVNAVPRVSATSPAKLAPGGLTDDGAFVKTTLPLKFPDNTVQSTAAINTAVAAQAVVTGSRALNANFHNVGVKPLFVSVVCTLTNGQTITGATDAAAAPTTTVAQIGNGSAASIKATVFFVVLPGNYYAVNGTAVLTNWTEWS